MTGVSVTTLLAIGGVGDPAAFFGRPRFLAEPSLLTDTFGFDAVFFMLAVPDGRPRFFTTAVDDADDATFGGGAAADAGAASLVDDADAATTAFFGVEPDGLPRFFFTGSPAFSPTISSSS